MFKKLKNIFQRAQTVVQPILLSKQATEDDKNAFFQACMTGDKDAVVRTLQEFPDAATWKEDVDTWTEESRGLRNAVVYGKWEIADLLLKSGANPNTLSGGEPVFVMATAEGQVDLIDTFIRLGVKIDIANQKDPECTALYVAINELADQRLVQKLIHMGADPQAVSSSPLVTNALSVISEQRQQETIAQVKQINAEMKEGINEKIVAHSLTLRKPSQTLNG